MERQLSGAVASVVNQFSRIWRQARYARPPQKAVALRKVVLPPRSAWQRATNPAHQPIPQTRVGLRTIQLNTKIRTIERELGIKRAVRGPALKGEQLARAVDKHARSIARWREEDE
jgi:hypothetical protein